MGVLPEVRFYSVGTHIHLDGIVYRHTDLIQQVFGSAVPHLPEIEDTVENGGGVGAPLLAFDPDRERSGVGTAGRIVAVDAGDRSVPGEFRIEKELFAELRLCPVIFDALRNRLDHMSRLYSCHHPDYNYCHFPEELHNDNSNV